MKSPPQQIHDDIAFNRVEAFIRGDDNETLVGTEKPEKRKLRKLAGDPGQGRDHRGVVTATTGHAPRTGRGSRRGRRPARVPAKAGERRLEAPHRRAGAGTSPRVVERLAVAGVSRDVVGPRRCCRPTSPRMSSGARRRRRTSPGRPSGAGRTATSGTSWDCRRTTRASARWPCAPIAATASYLVELMRLPTRPPEERAALVPDLDAARSKRLWREAPNGGGLIFVVGHVGSNDAVAAAIARHGMPISVVADDSSFPELFELLREQREAGA